MTWRMYAACIDLPLDLFFPQPGDGCAATIKAAKKVCHTCPVKKDCLEFAMAFEDKACPGIYGGTTERERHKLHTERRKFVKVPANR